MNFNFEFTFQSTTVQEIEAFETKYNIKLPEVYKQFLLRYNGGKPEKTRFMTVDGKIKSHAMLFLPISKESDSNLESYYEKYCLSKIVPSHLIPIAIDPLKDPICLSIIGADKVYLCNMQYFEEDGNVLLEENIKLVSESFTSFLNSLTKYEG